MESTYFSILPSELISILLCKLFGSPVVYGFIDFCKLNPSESFRKLCITVIPMLNRFNKKFVFRHRKISWISIYEGLLVMIWDPLKPLSGPLVDENFIMDQECFQDSCGFMRFTYTYICDDFYILMLYRYHQLCKDDIEKDDILYLYEFNIRSYYDQRGINVYTPGSLCNMEIYRDIIEKVYSNLDRRKFFYVDGAIYPHNNTINIDDTDLAYDRRNNYVLRMVKLHRGWFLVGILDNDKVRKLTKIEKTLASALGYNIKDKDRIISY